MAEHAHNECCCYYGTLPNQKFFKKNICKISNSSNLDKAANQVVYAQQSLSKGIHFFVNMNAISTVTMILLTILVEHTDMAAK